MKKPKCFKQWQLLIKKQIPLINKSPFAELIIYCALKEIRKKYGAKGIDRAGEKIDLMKLGFI